MKKLNCPICGENLRINCPVCGKGLVRLGPFEDGIYDFWCDACDIDITITKNDKVNTEE